MLDTNSGYQDQVKVKCDHEGCNQSVWVNVPINKPKAARHNLVKYGWRHLGKYDFCPEHKSRFKE